MTVRLGMTVESFRMTAKLQMTVRLGMTVEHYRMTIPDSMGFG